MYATCMNCARLRVKKCSRHSLQTPGKGRMLPLSLLLLAQNSEFASEGKEKSI
uniref:Uncharacterized protein n=1 Tax=Candidatus Nitrotoga fabula TaxID=2182327 RepID=A0A2X0QTL4_9PROT|nr:protein of unknown function [Candidatus Nitrotoga fabula]